MLFLGASCYSSLVWPTANFIAFDPICFIAGGRNPIYFIAGAPYFNHTEAATDGCPRLLPMYLYILALIMRESAGNKVYLYIAEQSHGHADRPYSY